MSDPTSSLAGFTTVFTPPVGSAAAPPSNDEVKVMQKMITSSAYNMTSTLCSGTYGHTFSP